MRNTYLIRPQLHLPQAEAEHAEAQAEDEALVATLDKLASEALDSTHRHAGSFEPAEGIKKVPLDPSHHDDKALQISATLDGK